MKEQPAPCGAGHPGDAPGSGGRRNCHPCHCTVNGFPQPAKTRSMGWDGRHSHSGQSGTGRHQSPRGSARLLADDSRQGRQIGVFRAGRACRGTTPEVCRLCWPRKTCPCSSAGQSTRLVSEMSPVRSRPGAPISQGVRWHSPPLLAGVTAALTVAGFVAAGRTRAEVGRPVGARHYLRARRCPTAAQVRPPPCVTPTTPPQEPTDPRHRPSPLTPQQRADLIRTAAAEVRERVQEWRDSPGWQNTPVNSRAGDDRQRESIAPTT